MHKKLLTSVLASATAITMVFAPCVTSFAEDGDVVKTDGTSAVVANHQTVNVPGDVEASGHNGSYQDNDGQTHYTADPAVVASNNAEVTIEGNVTAGKDSGAEQTAIKAETGANVVVGSTEKKVLVSGTAEGVEAQSSASITVNGDVSGARNGVAANNASVNVTGNVTGTGMEVDHYDDNGNVIFVGYAGDGVYASGNSTVHVGGDVHAPSRGNAIEVNLGDSSNGGKSSITVEGVATGTLNVHTNTQNHGLTKEEVIERLPSLTIYQVDGISTGFGLSTEEDNTAVRNELLSAINYIIKHEEGVTIDGNESSMPTTKIGNPFNVSATVDSDHMLYAGENVSVTDNGNGTYTLTLMNEHGGINVRAVLKPVPSSDGSGETKYEVVVEETPAYEDPNQAPAGAIVVNTVAQPSASGAAGQAAAPVSAISGDKPARTVSYNVSKITPIQYKNSIIQNVAAAPQGGAFNIETDRVTCFDSKMIEAFAARPDVDVNVVFTYGGKRLKVTIPAGYNVKTLLDSNGYCGFLRLLSILGGEELK